MADREIAGLKMTVTVREIAGLKTTVTDREIAD